jgi:NADPH2:quinone reductase
MRIVRSWQALSLDAYAIEETDVPAPGPGQVRIRVEACGVGYVDGLHATGRYQVKADLPFTPGVEIAGTIDALGPGVTHLSLGARVIPLMSIKGGFAEQVIAPAGQIALIPDNLNFEAAAAIRANTLTAIYALCDRGGVARGETVLVFGAAGGVGSAAVQVAKLMGARVIAAASSAAKRAAAVSLGADVAIDTQLEGWRDRLKAQCGSAMPDIVFDPVCGPLFEDAFRSIGWNGRYLVIGFTGGGIPALKANLPLLKGAALIGVDIRQFGLKQPGNADANRQRLCRWMESGKITPLVGKVFPFDQFRDALAYAASGAGIGKTILRF